MVKIAVMQINNIVGDIKGNTKKIISYSNKTKADLIVFPELIITGYPPKDLLFNKQFIQDNLKALDDIINKTKKAIVVGFVNKKGRNIFNSAAFINKGKLVGIQDKTYLPNYDVFDEKRYFTPSNTLNTFKIKDKKFAIAICHDLWKNDELISEYKKEKIDFVIAPSASPFYINKINERYNIIKRLALFYKIPIVYVNLIGGQDELIFDGCSMVLNYKGDLIKQGKPFAEDIFIINFKEKKIKLKQMSIVDQIKKAILLGIKDYAHKNNFKKVIIGLSGGIDSSLVAVFAVQALGNKNVIGVAMPSKISSKSSVDDARELASNLRINFKIKPINRIVDIYKEELKVDFKNTKEGVAEENIQSRIRGNLLMAFSNKFGYLVLTTGNKSETAMGYFTLFGDSAGGFAPLVDISKTMIYTLSKKEKAIPNNVIQKEPSAELKENQKDSDSLPPYNILDPIIEKYIEENVILNKDIVRTINKNEYKRRMIPLGIKITKKAFGEGRRLPVTNKY